MITAQKESFMQGLAELKPLLPLHYEELSLHKMHDFPLNPNYDDYFNRERNDQLLYVTIRENGALIGYFIGFVVPALHYQDCLTLSLDIFYVLPEYRGKNGGFILFSEVKRLAKERGVKVWSVGNKERSKVHATKLFEAMGFEKEETTYWMWL